MSREASNTLDLESVRMDVTVLGSGTCVPTADHYPSSYLVRTSRSNDSWLLDLGSGTLQRLSQAKSSYQQLDKVFVSHDHPDHAVGLIPLMQALNYTPSFHRTLPLTVYGTSRVRDFLEVNLDFAPALRPSYPFRFVVLDDGDETETADWSLRVRRVSHSTPALAARLTIGGHSLVYGADSEPCDALVELAVGADLLILEASFRKGQASRGHMTTTQAGDIARAANVPRLLISHMYPEVRKADNQDLETEVRASGYTGEITIACDLLVVPVTHS